MPAMDDDAAFAAIADERRKLADDVAGLTTEQWDTPSLCAAWTCRDVVAHLVVPLTVSIPAFGLAMIKASGNFDRANLAMTAKVAERYRDRLPTMLRDKADKRFTPPGYGPSAPLTDIVVHGLDIRRPLGMPSGVDAERQRAVLDFLTSPKAREIFSTVGDQVCWRATDIDWTAGRGPVIEGAAESLMLVLTGRRVGAEEIGGEGVSILKR
ncbi:maleylpyruvate isomerase family mycothiol-dependent enzyme [Gordonia sp. NPDC003422]